MKLHIIDTGYFKLDGGAMFGVVPKSIWQKMEQPDENNLCTWAMRCLLVEIDNRKILIDTGIGNKQDAKFFAHYYLHGDATLHKSLAQAGCTVDDITDVLCTHFHFDHIGGGVQRLDNGKLVPTFPNATYWTNEAHYNWAFNPNAREAASFLRENFVPLREEGILKFLDKQPFDHVLSWLPNFDIQFAYGHTEAMMLPHITYNGKKIVYCADLLASPSHIGMPYIMGYDVRPLHTLEEKEWLLPQAADEGYILFFEHAPHVEACTVRRNDKGKIVVDKQGKLFDFLA